MVPFHPMTPMELPALSLHSDPVLRSSHIRVNGVFVLNSRETADALAGGEETRTMNGSSAGTETLEGNDISDVGDLKGPGNGAAAVGMMGGPSTARLPQRKLREALPGAAELRAEGDQQASEG